MFLGNGTDIHKAIEQLLSEQNVEPVKIAVAYWGRGASSLLSVPFRVVCNLKSGACDPQEIRAIWTQDPEAIRQMVNLHAKVVLTDTGAVVSSANCSSNGLGLESAAGPRWEEAGFLVREESELEKMEDWFSRIWENAKRIYEKDIADAEALWQSRSQGTFERPPVDVTALVEAQVGNNHRMRSATLPIRELIKAAMPKVGKTEVGKIAAWATHFVMARSGSPLPRYDINKNAEGDATEEWLLTRRIHGAETQKRIMLALQVLAQSDQVQEEARYWADHLLKDLPWSQR